jgi:hypothetical protein
VYRKACWAVIGAGGFSGCLTLVSVGVSEQAERRRIKPSEAKTLIYFYCPMPRREVSTVLISVTME